MTQASTPPLPEGVPLPRLSDDAAAEIYLFLEHMTSSIGEAAPIKGCG